jgi:thymidylate synthase (FAD)
MLSDVLKHLDGHDALYAFAAMCQLRCASDTQYESRVVADQISEKMSELFPVSWEALMEGQDDE